MLNIFIVLLNSGLVLSATAKQLPEPIVDSDYHFNGAPSPAKVDLGRFLFFDKVLSGNLNISCGTCHHGLAGSGDGLALPVGEGGRGLGIARNLGGGADAVIHRVPRNAPPYFNLAHKGFTQVFHDGRVRVDASAPSGFASPAGTDLPLNLDTVMAAQAMFPVTSGAEMAGQPGENAQADFAAIGFLPDLWGFVASKVAAVPAYVPLFVAAFNDVNSASDITYSHIANAIAAWENVDLRSDNTPFDYLLRGDPKALSVRAKKGMNLFFGKAGCANCHEGESGLLSDMQFHAIAMPQIGPGKGDGFSAQDDFGLEKVTGNPSDRYKFRTPPLRNVALTAPYGHSGAYETLEAVVLHHLDPVAGINAYDQSQVRLPSRPDLDALDFVVMNNPSTVAAIVAANELSSTNLKPAELIQLMAFLKEGLTDPAFLDIRRIVPLTVPSGLPVAD